MTIVKWIDLFSRLVYRDIIVDSLNYCIEKKGLVVYSWVIMSSHIHLIVRVKDDFLLSDTLRDFKKYTSKELIKTIKAVPESRREWMLHEMSFVSRNE